MMPRGTISWHTRPLFAVEERRQRREESVTIDLSSLSMDDLRSLESSDPFLFHSIPEVHRARLAFKEVDLCSFDFSERGADESRNSISNDSSNTAGAGSPRRPSRRFSSRTTGSTLNSSTSSLASSIVSRKSRVSTECHVSLIMDDLLDFDDDMISLGNSASDVDDLMESLTGCSFQ